MLKKVYFYAKKTKKRVLNLFNGFFLNLFNGFFLNLFNGFFLNLFNGFFLNLFNGFFCIFFFFLYFFFFFFCNFFLHRTVTQNRYTEPLNTHTNTQTLTHTHTHTHTHKQTVTVQYHISKTNSFAYNLSILIINDLQQKPYFVKILQIFFKIRRFYPFKIKKNLEKNCKQLNVILCLKKIQKNKQKQFAILCLCVML